MSLNKLFLIYTQLDECFEINLEEPMLGRQFFSFNSSFNVLQLDLHSVYKFTYEKDGWVFMIRHTYKHNKKVIHKFVVKNYKELSMMMKSLRRELFQQIRNEQCFATSYLKYSMQVAAVEELLPKDRLFVHTSLRICNRMKRQRLNIAIKKRANLVPEISSMDDFFTKVLNHLGWLMSPSSIEKYWKITRSLVRNEDVFGRLLSEELVTSISLETNNLNIKP